MEGKILKNQMLKKREKRLVEPLTLDKIIESCLILMVLLLLTRARHLIVDCTASESPYFHHQVALRLQNCSIPFTSPPSPFLSCLPSVIGSVTSPVILPRVCKSWLFVLKHVNLMEASPFLHPQTNKKKKTEKTTSEVESQKGDDLPLGAS